MCVCEWVKVCEKQRQWERKPGAYPAYIGVRPHSFRTSVDRATHWSYCVNCTQSVQSVCSEPQFYRRIAAQIGESLNMKSSSAELNVYPLWFWVNIMLLFVDGSTCSIMCRVEMLQNVLSGSHLCNWHCRYLSSLAPVIGTAGPSRSGSLYMLRRCTDRALLKVILSVLKWCMKSFDFYEIYFFFFFFFFFLLWSKNVVYCLL